MVQLPSIDDLDLITRVRDKVIEELFGEDFLDETSGVHSKECRDFVSSQLRDIVWPKHRRAIQRKFTTLQEKEDTAEETWRSECM